MGTPSFFRSVLLLCALAPLLASCDDTPGVAEVFPWAPGPAPEGALTTDATYDGTTCANVYCHGAAWGGGFGAVDNDARDIVCGGCHGVNQIRRLSQPHESHLEDDEIDCVECHGTATRTFDGVILLPEQHVDGTLDLDLPKGFVRRFDKGKQDFLCEGVCHETVHYNLWE